MLGLDLDSWNTLMVSFLGIGAIAAVVVGISTFAVIKLQKAAEEQTKLDFEAYKLTAEGKVADAKKEGIEAGKIAGDALVRAAALEKQAEELRAINIALEAKIQPRRISGAKSTEMSGILSKFSGLSIAIVSRFFDAEAKDFGDDLDVAFKAAGWKTFRDGSWTMYNKGVFTATLEGTTFPTEIEGVIRSALSANGMQAERLTIETKAANTMSPPFQTNVLYILVGAKP